MKYDSKSRRMFLVGGRNFVLAAPFLPSLLPREAWGATSAPTRYVQMMINWGHHQRAHAVPDARAFKSKKTANGVSYLENTHAEVAAALKAGVGSGRIDPSLYKHLIFARGLNGCRFAHTHNNSFATTANIGTQGSHSNTDLENPISIDWVLENSKSMYPGAFSGRKAARFISGRNPLTRQYGSNSFRPSSSSGTGAVQLTGHTSPRALFDDLFDGFKAPSGGGGGGSGGGSGIDPQLKAQAERENRVTNLVFENYKAAMQSRKISSLDRNRLDQFMNLINTTTMEVPKESMVQMPSATSTSQCVSPARPADTWANFKALHDKGVDIMLAGLLCDRTRVGSYQIFEGDAGMAYNYDRMHPWSHGSSEAGGVSAADGMSVMTRFKFDVMNRFLKGLMELQDPNGEPLMQSTLFYYANEFASASENRRPELGSDTTPKDYYDVPIILAGNANGALKPGSTLHFEGRPYNLLFNTMCNALNVPRSEYERGTPGYGIYYRSIRGNAIDQAQYVAKTFDQYWQNDGQKRANLPLIY